MLVLDGGSWWSSWSCGTRPLLVYGVTLAVVAGYAGFFMLRTRIEVWYRGAPVTELSPGERRARPYIVAFIVAAAALLAIVPPLTRHRDMIFVANNQVVETGCHMFSALRYEFAADSARINYVYYDPRKGGDQHTLIIRPSGRGRTLDIDLNESRDLGNLAILAPDEIAKYARKLLESGKPVPAVLRHLLPPTTSAGRTMHVAPVSDRA